MYLLGCFTPLSPVLRLILTSPRSSNLEIALSTDLRLNFVIFDSLLMLGQHSPVSSFVKFASTKRTNVSLGDKSSGAWSKTLLMALILMVLLDTKNPLVADL